MKSLFSKDPVLLLRAIFSEMPAPFAILSGVAVAAMRALMGDPNVDTSLPLPILIATYLLLFAVPVGYMYLNRSKLDRFIQKKEADREAKQAGKAEKSTETR